MSQAVEDLQEENERLRRRLRESRQTVQALIEDEVDAVLESGSATPVLLVEAQQALLESEEAMRAIFRGALDAMLITDDDGRYVDANPAACEMFNLPKEKLIGQRVFQFTASERDTESRWRSFLDEGEMSGEFILNPPNGGRRHLEYTATANIQPGRHLAVLRDVTEKKKIESQFLQSQKMEAVGRLASGVAHDFNNMLAAILGYGKMIQGEVGPETELRRDITEIVEAAERAEGLTRRLLAFSRSGYIDAEPLDLNGLIRTHSKMMRRVIGDDIGISLELCPSLKPISADPGQVEQVLMNLLINARDAMPNGGEVRIVTSCEEVSVSEARKHPELEGGDFVMVAIEDTGVGMSDSVRQKIFEPFFTTKNKEQGTGLGLSMVYGMIQRNGGFVDVESTPGEGSVFKIFFPVCHEAVDDEASDEDCVSYAEVIDERAVQEEQGAGTVLIVEDESLVCRLATQVLERAGYEVLQAPRPGEALRIAVEYSGDIDVLLTDVVMPTMSGPVLASRILDLKPDIKVIFMSGYAADEMDDVPEFDEAPFLKKPFSPDVLTGLVSEALA